MSSEDAKAATSPKMRGVRRDAEALASRWFHAHFYSTL